MPPDLIDLMLTVLPHEGVRDVPELGLKLLHTRGAEAPGTVWQEPSLVLVLQGTKRGRLGMKTYEVHAGQMLVVHLPLLMTCDNAVLEGEPFLAMTLRLDATLIAELLLAAGERPDAATPDADPVGRAVADLGEADRLGIARLLLSIDDPLDRHVLGNAMRRELHYRALCGPAGPFLQALVRQGSRMWSIWRVIQQMRVHLDRTPDMGQLARDAAMSQSLFYAEFRRHTGCSPLQYLKHLRLQRARELLSVPGQGVAQVAFALGYVSASQFSREYKRAFGHVPSEAVSLLE